MYKKFDFKKLYFLLYIFLILLVVSIFFKLGLFLFPFVLGIFFSILCQPLSLFLKEKLNLSHKISIILSISFFLLVFLSIIVFSSLKLIEEIYKFSQNLKFYSSYIQQIWNISIDKFYYYLGILPEGFNTEITAYTNKFISLGTHKIALFINKFISIITSIPTAILYTCITILSTFFISIDKIKILNFLEHQFPKSWLDKIYTIKSEMFNVLGTYIKAQFILMSICFIELLITLNILSYLKFNVQYPLIMSIFICIIDALPILGAGAILLPWVLFNILSGDFLLAFFLFLIYLLVLSVRQMLEPKLISQNLGVHPLITLISMYSGFKLLGFSGFLIGPIIMIILKNVFSRELETGFFKDIFTNNSNE